ncbi:MAG: hypothetical protein ACRDGM_20590 [bacterium]
MDSSSNGPPGDLVRAGDETDELTAKDGFVAYGLDLEAERVIQAAFTKALEVAGPNFGQAIRDLQTTVARAEPFALVGALAMYCGTAEAGANPEFNRKLGVFQHHIELVQAFVFGPRTEPHHDLDPPSLVVEDVARAVRQLTDAWLLLEARKVVQASPGPDRDLAHVLFGLRVKAMSVRGWGYQKRMLIMLQTLLAPLDESVESALGWRPSAFPGWWMAIDATVNRRLDVHRAAVREAADWPVDDRWLHRVREQFATLPVEDEDMLVVSARADENIRRGFVYHSSDLRAHEIFRFELTELANLMPTGARAETVRAVLNAWSLAPGFTGDAPTTKVFLENPVVNRPFLVSGPDQWHLFCGWLLWHNFFGLIEQLLDGHEALFDAYLRRRSEFLEQSTAQLLAQGLPGAQVETALLYTDPTDGKEYETDVLVLLDSYALVAEAKSGRPGPEARRGKGRQLRDRIADLLVAPSEQAHRLADLLMNAERVHTFRRKTDGTAVTIRPGTVRRVITLGITLEPLALVLPRLSELAEAGLSERTADALAYSVSVPDLEVVLLILEHPSEVLHYLARRAEIERRAFLRGDEADLLGLYLQTGFNLGEKEFQGGHTLDVTGMSDPIDRWHYRQDAGMEAERPRVQRTPWWEAVLTRMEKSRFPRWPEIGVSMCNVAPADQAKLEAAMEQLRDDINTGRRPATDVVVFQNGPPQRRDVFVGLIAASPDREKRAEQYRAAGGVAMREYGLQRAIVLAWAPVPIEAPYFAIGLVEV